MSHSNQPRTPRGRWRFLGKTERIYVRVTPGEKARIAALADREEMSLSDYLIRCATTDIINLSRNFVGRK